MDKTEKRDAPLTPFVCCAVIVFLVWCIAGIVSWKCGYDWAIRGQFGDSFGAINALFSGLAFAGVIFTILLQRNELALQRQELEDTRAELKRSAEAQEKSQAALTQQVAGQRVSARLAALTALVNMYSHNLDNLSTYGNKERENYQNHLAERLLHYQQLLEQAFLDMERQT